MRKIRLYGWLAREFGREFTMDVKTPAEAVRALCSVVPGFKDALRNDLKHVYRVMIGAEILDPKTQLHDPAGDVIRIIPIVQGAKDGILRTIAGMVLVVAGYAVNLYSEGAAAPLGNAMIGMGISMMAGGISEMLTKQPGMNPDLTRGPADTPTYTFAGPVNTVGQGYPVGVAYGRIRVGSAIVSGGIDSQTFRRDHGAPDEVGTRGGNGDTTPWVWAIAAK